jgi:signal transduction histidine kinase
MEKKQKSFIAVYGIIFVLFNVIYLGIPFVKTAASWIVYGFTLISILASFLIAIYAFFNGEGLTSKVYGFPVFRIGYLYAGSQLALCIIISFIAAFTEVATWIPTILSIVLMGVAAIGVIATDNARDVVEEIDQNIVEKTRTVVRFRLDVEGIVDCCQDTSLKKSIEKLSEAIRYSDPVSNEQLKSIEDKLGVEVNNLSEMVTANDVEAAQKKVLEIQNLLAERNRKCKALK